MSQKTHQGFYEKKTAMGTTMAEINPNTQHSLKAQKKRYEKAELLKLSVKFTSPETAIVPSQTDQTQVFHCRFAGDDTYCECSSWSFGVARDEKFLCKHQIAAQERWSEINAKKG